MMLHAGHEGPLVALHNPQCAVREEAMPYGMTAMTAVALQYLGQRRRAVGCGKRAHV